MSFTWIQNTGTMLGPDGAIVGTGYAGNHAGLNNHAMQALHGVGPLPVGKYTIGPLEAKHGALGVNVCALIPDPANEMFGRSGFFLHGRKSPTDMDASEGCIVLDHDPRMVVANSADRELVVIAEAVQAVS